jgi:hypothetical protein
MAMYQMGVGQRLVFRVHPRAQNQSQRSGNRDLARDSWRLLRFRSRLLPRFAPLQSRLA